jgi:hypothetical protein
MKQGKYFYANLQALWRMDGPLLLGEERVLLTHIFQFWGHMWKIWMPGLRF